MVKEAFVSINFHAHEPLWDLQSRAYQMTGDAELSGMFPSVNHLRKRMDAGNDIYSFAVNLAEKLDIPFGIEMTNELIHQLLPYKSTIDQIKKGFEGRVIYPILGNAHHTHSEFLTEEELTQEILQNREALMKVFEVALPSPVGYFPSECSIESRSLLAIGNAGVDYVIFPHIEKQEHLLEVKDDRIQEIHSKPFYVTDGKVNLLALPRSFVISQEIWRPLTKLVTDKASKEGYCLGMFPVLDEEFVTGKFVSFPITLEEAVEEYAASFEKAVLKCPNRGLLLFIQDLELMGVGREMLDLLKKALERIGREVAGTRIIFTSLEDYVKTHLEGFRDTLPSVQFRRICWAPEIHGELRVDGLYLPLGVREYRGVEASKIYSEDPFIFWTPGSHILKIFSKLLQGCLPRKPRRIKAEQLLRVNYDISKLRINSRIFFLHLLQKGADNWGWRPDEDRQKWAFLYGYLILKCIEEYAGKRDSFSFEGFAQEDVDALRVYPKIFLEPRINYLTEGLKSLGKQTNPFQIENALASAKDLTRKVYLDIEDLKILNRNLKEGKTSRLKLLVSLKAFCKDFCLATDAIQHVWAASGNPDFLVTEMYKYLHGVYPPLYPNLGKIKRDSERKTFTLD